METLINICPKHDLSDDGIIFLSFSLWLFATFTAWELRVHSINDNILVDSCWKRTTEAVKFLHTQWIFQA